MTFPRGSTQPCFQPKPGDLIGNYRIEETLAEGGMGSVHRASHVILPRRAAVKILHADLLTVRSAIERMLQEVRILETISHASFAKVYEAGRLEDGRPWVAMELAEGQTLNEYCDEHGPLPLRDVAKLLVQISEALRLAHRLQIIHRDVKPENIVVSRQGEEFSIKLIDWGIAQVGDETALRLTQLDVAPGTPHYMAPELLRGERVGEAADIYALGIVAYELLVGEPPFVGETSVDIAYSHLHHDPQPLLPHRPDAPRWLDQLIAAMLDRNPANRPSLRVVQMALLSEVQRPLDDEELAPTISIVKDDDTPYYDQLRLEFPIAESIAA